MNERVIFTAIDHQLVECINDISSKYMPDCTGFTLLKIKSIHYSDSKPTQETARRTFYILNDKVEVNVYGPEE